MCGHDGQKNPEHRPENEGEQVQQWGIWSRLHSVSRLQRIAAEAGVLALYFLFEAHSVWPESHGWALFQGALGTCVVLAIELPPKWLIPVSAVIGTAAWAIYAAVGPNLPAETETHGWLLPANDPTPQTACAPENTKQGDWLFVTLGGGGVLTIAKGKITALTIGNQPTVLIERKPSGLLVDVDMLAENGDLAVHIAQNEWRAIPYATSFAERPDRSTLVVHDRAGREMFWLRYMNSNTVKIRGTFHDIGDARPIVISDEGISLDPKLGLYIPFMSAPVPFVPCLVVGTPEFEGPILQIK